MPAERLKREAASNRRAARRAEQEAAAAPFTLYHQRVRLFSLLEVEEHNAQLQPQSPDRWRLGSGLLLHHCCYLDCPDYLRNFATPADAADPSGRRRHGLMRHLRHNHLLHEYVRGFHLVAYQAARHPPAPSFEAFVAAVERHYAAQPAPVRAAYRDLAHRERYLRDAWDAHKKQ